MSSALPNWLERFLGLEARAGEGTVWSLETSWGWAPWITLLLVVFVVLWVSYYYAREGGSVGRWRRALLIFVRLTVVGLVLLMIAEVMISFQRTGLPHVVVAVDESVSMGIEDVYFDEELRGQLEQRLGKVGLERLTRLNLAKLLLLENDAALLSAIEKDYKLKVYFLAGTARAASSTSSELIDEVKALEAVGEVSRLGDGLREMLADLRGTPPAAIILLTDGVTTEGETLGEAAAYARRKGVPLITVGVGSEDPVRDVELSDLLVDEAVFVDDMVNFQSTVRATGLEGREVPLVLREKGKEEILGKTTVALPDDERSKTVHIPYRPPNVGKVEYEVAIAPLEGETQVDNNRQTRLVDVHKEKIRVLLAQAYPNYEFRYLKTMLERDSTIELNTVLQEADLDYAQQDKSALRVFPVRREELLKYDVILFGDVNPSLLSATVMASIRDLVQEKGGGIVFLSGPRYMPMAYHNTPLAGLLPIDATTASPTTAGDVLSEGFSPQPTMAGLTSPHMQLGDTPEETAALWQNLSPMYWLLEAPRLKPAARVLAEHPTRLTADGRKLPVFVMQYAGAGKVLFHASDETWRWRYRLGDALFARYWVQAIRYLARSKLLGGDRGAELTVDRREYQRGDAVRVRVRFVDERLAPVADDGVTVTLEQAGQKTRRLKLRRHASSRGVFEGMFTGARPGSYHVWVTQPTLAGRAPAADFQVAAPPGEFERVEMDVADLTRAAEQSRGGFYTIATADRLLDELPPGHRIPVETLPPAVLWNRWWVLATLLGLLVTEWIVRKRSGLL